MAGKDKVIYKHNIPSEDIEALIRYQENEEAFPCALVEEDGIYQNYVDDSVRQLYDMLDFPHPPLRPLRGNGGKEVYQLIAFSLPAMKNVSCPSCRIARLLVGTRYLRMSCAGSSKAVGIDKDHRVLRDLAPRDDGFWRWRQRYGHTSPRQDQGSHG